jgi:hypothetical protein
MNKKNIFFVRLSNEIQVHEKKNNDIISSLKYEKKNLQLRRCMAAETCAYRRVEHFIAWLKYAQALERERVPQNIIREVRDALLVHWELTPELVAQTLRALRLHKYLQHTIQIMCNISGAQPLRLSTEQTNNMVAMFMNICRTWFQNCCSCLK